jgi:thiol:disulfide interchange protein DsbD
VAIVLAVAVSPVRAGEGQVRASLVSDFGSGEPGVPFVLGVLLEPEPGWHVYWRYPGGAGLATEVRFELPPGFEAAELGWPIPVTFEQPGGIVGYGYEEPVVLAAEITPAAEVEEPVQVAVEASWLACKDVCVLGSTRVVAELPLGGPTRALSLAAIERWESELPEVRDAAPFDITLTGGPVPASGAAALTLWLSGWRGGVPAEVEFFPDPGPGLKVEGTRVSSRGPLTRVDLRLARLATPSPPAAWLEAVVVTRSADAERRGLRYRFMLE